VNHKTPKYSVRHRTGYVVALLATVCGCGSLDDVTPPSQEPSNPATGTGYVLPSADGYQSNPDGQFGDLDHDRDVDMGDFARFLDCVAGPKEELSAPGCVAADLDGNLTVDLADFAVLQQVLAQQPLAIE